MTHFFRTAVYYRNVPGLERSVRLALAAGLAALPSFWSLGAGAALGVWVSAVGLAATGFIGFCPACYLAGRSVVARKS